MLRTILLSRADGHHYTLDFETKGNQCELFKLLRWPCAHKDRERWSEKLPQKCVREAVQQFRLVRFQEKPDF